MSNVENLKKSIGKHAGRFIFGLSIGVLLIVYSLGRIWKDQPLFRRHTRDLSPPNNAGGAYYAALKADDNRSPHYFLISIGIVFLLLATYHLILVLRKKSQLNKQ